MSACSRNLAHLYGLAAAAGFTLGACSLIVDFTECTSDAQCNVDGAADWMCLDGKCVPPEGSTGSPSGEPPASSSSGDAPPTTEPGETTTTGDTTAQVTITTTDDSSTGTTDNTTGPSGCTLNSECIAEAGDGWLCIDGACVNALTAECNKLVLPEDNVDKVVFVGSIIPSSDPYAPLTLPLQNALQLAIADYNVTTDLPGGYGVGWVTCDDKGELDLALAAAEHLTGTLKIQAIVGPIFSEQVIAVAEQVTVPAGVFSITPTATAREITTLPDDGLVWRTITSDAYQANAIADRVLDLEMPAVGKLALLYKDDAYGNGLADDITARLMVPLGMDLTLHPYPDPTTLTPSQLMIAYGTVLSQAYGGMGEDHPDTLILAGTTEVASLVHGTLLLWKDEGVPLPRFIVSHGAVPSMEDTVKSPNVSDPLKQPLMGVLEGTAPVIFDPQNFASFNARYKVVFNETDAITASSLSYDAGMLVMFAMAAVPMGEPITGAKIAANIEKLQDPAGTKVSFGDVMGLTLTFIKTAHNALVTGQTVDLKGVSGELQFDLATGEPRTNIIGWGLEPKVGDPNTPLLKQKRVYELDPAPLETGQWMDL
jgi:ABC-type branched-subunit amino acid transport system substrate-binding protein